MELALVRLQRFLAAFLSLMLVIAPAPAHAFTVWELLGIDRSATLNYEVRVTLSFDGVIREGRGVWRMKYTHTNMLLVQVRGSWVVWGEAIPIEGPDGVTYFVLRKPASWDKPPSPNDGSGPGAGAYPVQCQHRLADRLSSMVDALKRFEGPCLARAHPHIVTLSDKTDPKTVEPVLYNDVSPAWEGAFDTPKSDWDTDIEVLSVVVQRVNEPVTTGLSDQLPWLKTMSPYAQLETGEPLMETGFRWHIGSYYALDFSTEASHGYRYPP